MGVDKMRLERVLSPPWTTDWMSEDGRASCANTASRRPARPLACPRCGSTQVRTVSQFGSTPCKANYACEDCLEPFDYFKCI